MSRTFSHPNVASGGLGDGSLADTRSENTSASGSLRPGHRCHIVAARDVGFRYCSGTSGANSTEHQMTDKAATILSPMDDVVTASSSGIASGNSQSPKWLGPGVPLALTFAV